MSGTRTTAILAAATLLLLLAACPKPREPAAAFSADATVEIEWKGMWFPGTVLAVDGERFQIHYDDYDDSWNEWVPVERLRPRQKPRKPAPAKGGKATTHYVITIDAASSRADAVKIAKSASSALMVVIAEDTLAKPPAQRTIVGSAVAIHHDKEGEAAFVVTSYLSAEPSWSNEEVARVRRHYPGARVQEVRLRDGDLNYDFETYSPTRILVLGSKKDWVEADRLARRIAARTGDTYSTRGMIYDAERGLIWPDTFSDEIYAGSYYGRRYNDCDAETAYCISVERSDFYFGLEAGYYIVTAGFVGDDFRSAVRHFQGEAPDAYAKKTVLWMGCAH